jgi:peptide/nickel transport system ATP-binding protein
MDTFLEARHLGRRFMKEGHTVSAVEDVSFSLFRGECLGVAGASGSGKSTLARMACGLLPPSEGELLLEGSPVSFKERKKLYQKMQMVFQLPRESFDSRMTLGQSVMENLHSRQGKKGNREEMERLFMDCGLPVEMADKYPHEVSGGECQRAAIARALASRPECLVCDEAVSALDMEVQKGILDLLMKLKTEKGLTLLFISHDLAVISYLSDRVIIMEQGKIVEQGKTESVIRHPQHPYTKKLLAAVL